jgi:hypothetical protein
MSSLLCNKPKPVLQQFSGELPKVDSAYYTQCLVRYKSSLYDDNLALTFNIRIIYLEEEISQWLVADIEKNDNIILDNLNNSFNKQGISFVIKESNIDVSSESINSFLAHYEDYEEEGVLTIIVYSNVLGASYNGIASGVPGIVMGIVEDKINTSTLPHEMGHLLGLGHVFEKDDTDGLNSITGDKICDTPEFNIMHNQSVECTYVGPPLYTKEALEVLIPNYLNYNSQHPYDCRDKFTPVQILAIRWHVENYPRLYDALLY